MSIKILKVILILVLVFGFVYVQNREDDDSINTELGNNTDTITFFDKNSELFSDAFVSQFKIKSDMNERWLGILAKKNGNYELYHFTMPIHEAFIEYEFNISQVSELYICSQHIDYFVGEVYEPNSKKTVTQFQMDYDINKFESTEITGSYFKGIIDVIEVDVEALDGKICYRYYTGNTDQPPIETWSFNLKD